MRVNAEIGYNDISAITRAKALKLVMSKSYHNDY